MKNILKVLLAAIFLFGSVPTLTAMDNSNGMEEIKKKKKKGKKLKGKASKGLVNTNVTEYLSDSLSRFYVYTGHRLFQSGGRKDGLAHGLLKTYELLNQRESCFENGSVVDKTVCSALSD